MPPAVPSRTAPRAAAILAAVVMLSACARVEAPAEPLRLVPLRFAQLVGWEKDRQGEALAAFVRSCAKLEERDDSEPVGVDGLAGTVADWRGPCRAARRVAAADDHAARAFFERWFRPHRMASGTRTDGLFTGYFEPELRGSSARGGAYTVPLYGRPPDLVTADLGRFDPELRGRRIAGRVVAGELEPFATRAEIGAGALAGRGLEIVWVDDPVDAFFLQVQGSGRVRLDGGATLRLGYGGGNGHPYVSIGEELIRRGAIGREKMSMQAVAEWMRAHPEEEAALMAMNPSYVFFRILEGEGPVGTQGVALTPGRSLAVDTAFLPLGVPVWIDVRHPDGEDPPVRRLLVAQDTGSAIRGPLRGDVFWGFGGEASARAGGMRHSGGAYLLLPLAADRGGPRAGRPLSTAG